MKLEAGKRYVLRCGMITPPISECKDRHYPFSLSESGLSWTLEGKYCDGVSEHDLDIISEYVEPAKDIDRMRFTDSTRWNIEKVNQAINLADALIERLNRSNP